MKEFFRNNIILILIVFLAIILRFYNLSQIPVGFNDDEAAFGYNASSILQTARDEWGRFLPFPVFESFGDWKLVGYLYSVVLSQLVFGVSEFATRLPSAIFGVLAVFSTYLLTKKLFEKSFLQFTIYNLRFTVAPLAALLLAISPWHIAASRNAFESDILIFFLTISTYFFLRGLSEKKYQTISILGFAASFYIYRSAWIFTPFLVGVLIYLSKTQLSRYKIFFAKNIIFALILLLPLVPSVLTFRGQSRFFQESFILGVQKQGIIDEVNERRGRCESILGIGCQLVYNKYNFFLIKYFNNYISNLSPETYYIKGTETGYQSFPQRGFFYTFELSLFLAGLIFLLKRKQPASYLLICWLLIVPLGPSFTAVGNPGRLNILMPIPQIIAALGLVWVFSYIRSERFRRVLLLALVIIALSSMTRLAFDTFFQIPQVSARYQRYGYKQLFQYLESQKQNYQRITVSRKSDDAKQYIHYLFFTKFDPATFQNTIVRHRDENGWVIVEEIGKIKFVPTLPPTELLPDKSLVAVGEHEIELNVKPIYTINDFRGDRIFEVYDGNALKVAQKEHDEELEKLKSITNFTQ